MIATGKHFPGHGDTDVNSHLALPVVTASRARLDSVELPPFRASIAAGVGATMHHQHAGSDSAFSGAADPYLKGLASHLKATDAKFFGASWCPHCQQQKALFGAAAKYLPYIECSPHGAGTPQATTCLAHEIKRYPSWIIADKLYAKPLTVDHLSRISGYDAPPRAK